ncbi:hypothetical protein [Gallionella capsiferriformans]|uniref:Uncharacterized protein n=1 Tax=Gallionella capsiferriformans (strain ES-2) TaxID=395494 RepID=D9SHT9_GALCS|nr:hypothetical protein [Gallionella capsiferriformans]ADL56029.1 hypothetical protein Galf_2023 [Gallionella capsiferriformans ES-2]
MSAAQPVDQAIDEVCVPSNVMWQLWERTKDSLSNPELEWFAQATEQAQTEARNLRDVAMGIGCLVASDTQSGAFQDKHNLPQLLFSLSAQLDTITGMIEIGSAANDRLRMPELYQRFKDAHGRG